MNQPVDSPSIGDAFVSSFPAHQAITGKSYMSPMSVVTVCLRTLARGIGLAHLGVAFFLLSLY
jgi:hypothetical protein